MNKTYQFRKFIEIIKNRKTISGFLIVAFLAAALFSIFISPQLYQGAVNEGDIALKDIYAPYDFTYFWGINEEETAKVRKDAAGGVPYLFLRDLVSEKDIISRLTQFFDILSEEKEKEVPVSEKIAGLKEKVKEGVSERAIKVLLEYPDFAILKQKTLDIIEDVFLAGFINKKDLDYLKAEETAKISIFNEETNTETDGILDDLVEESGIHVSVEDFSSKQFIDDRKTAQAVTILISSYILPNLKLDKEKTDAKREEMARKIKPVYHKWTVKKNELVIEKGKRVNARHIAQVLQLRQIFRPGMTSTFFFGILLLFLLLGLISAIYMSFIQKINFLNNTKGIAIVLVSMLFIISASDFIMRSPQSSYFIPMASMGMMIMLLVGFNMAFISVMLMSVLISLLVGGGIALMLVLVIGSMVGMFAVRDLRRRTKILWAGLAAGLAKFTAIACIGLINSMDLNFYLKEGVWCVGSGLFSGFIVMGLLPIFEYLFKIPTNISLLELSDLNHPLLKELALEAPGTYHHSIMVGNLAESACDSIGANSLLARVGAYYHDIGKMPNAEYFSENEMGSKSKHSSLTPSMSALIIGKHVKRGIEIAKKYNLNNTIIGFITQHHGDSLISYFYQKAMEKSKDGTVLEEENFRYPGPKPQTKESAIILLADAVEAASRTLNDSTPSSIRNLVRKMINNKFIDGQLDECDLTLKDMHKIANSFVRVLMGTSHTRLDYPEEINKLQNEKLPYEDKNKQRKPKQKKKY